MVFMKRLNLKQLKTLDNDHILNNFREKWPSGQTTWEISLDMGRDSFFVEGTHDK